MRFLWNASPTSDECGSFVFRSIQDPCWDTVGARVITASTLINASFLIIWVLQRGGGNVVVLLWPKGGYEIGIYTLFRDALNSRGKKGVYWNTKYESHVEIRRTTLSTPLVGQKILWLWETHTSHITSLSPSCLTFFKTFYFFVYF